MLRDELKEEANKAFHNSLKTALTEFQHEIVNIVQMNHDNLIFEKERRSENIFIDKYPETLADQPSERLKYDIEFDKKVTKLLGKDIVKCIRAGPKEYRTTGHKRTARP